MAQSYEPAGRPKFLPLFPMNDGVQGEPIPDQYSPWGQDQLFSPWPQQSPMPPQDPMSFMGGVPQVPQVPQIPGVGMGLPPAPTMGMPPSPNPMSAPGMPQQGQGMMGGLPPAPPGPYSGGPIHRLRQFMQKFNQGNDAGLMALVASAAMPGVVNPQQGISNLMGLQQQQLEGERTQAMYGERGEQHQATREYRQSLQEDRFNRRADRVREHLQALGVYDEFEREYGPILEEADLDAAMNYASIARGAELSSKKLGTLVKDSYRLGVPVDLTNTEWEHDEKAQQQVSLVNEQIARIADRKAAQEKRAQEAHTSLQRLRAAVTASRASADDKSYILGMIRTEQGRIDDLETRRRALESAERKLREIDIFDQLDSVEDELFELEHELTQSYNNIRQMQELPEFAHMLGKGTGGQATPPQQGAGTTQAPTESPQAPDWIKMFQDTFGKKKEE